MSQNTGKEWVLNSAVNVILIGLLDIEVIHHKCVPPKAVDCSLSLNYKTYTATQGPGVA
jgi:hypothetical protein